MSDNESPGVKLTPLGLVLARIIERERWPWWKRAWFWLRRK